MKANSVRVKPVPITLDKERHIKYDFNAFIELEEKYGSINQALEALRSEKMKDIRTLLWVGLIHEDEQLTERQVGAAIENLGDLGAISTAILEAIQAALPEVDEAKNK